MKEAMGGEDKTFIDREKEYARINDLMSRKKNFIIFGKEGTGKTTVIRKILSERSSRDFLYSKESKTLREALINLILFGSEVKKDIYKKNILALKKIFYTLLDNNPEYVIFDHIPRLEPSYYAFLTYLMDRDVPLIVLTRGLDKENIGHLWKVIYYLEKVEVPNLDKSGADRLISHYIDRFSLNIAEENEFKTEVFDISKGNPKIIKDLCLLAQDEQYRAKGYIDVKLMDLDRRINNSVMGGG